MDRRGYRAVLLLIFLYISLSVLSVKHGTKISANRRFRDSNVSVINSFIDATLFECKTECKKRPRCTSVDNIYRAKYCRLHGNGGTALTASGSFVIAGFNSNVSCGDHTCRPKETCDTSTNTCVIEECGYPKQRMDIKGNMFNVGSKVTHLCVLREDRLTCMEDGTWWNVQQLLSNENNGVTCKDIRLDNAYVTSGVYKNKLGMDIYCDYHTDGGDWIVFQRRWYGFEPVNFNRTWVEYKEGFGNLCGEFWLGLEKIYQIMAINGGEFELRIDIDRDWDWRYAVYGLFIIGDENDNYRLHVGQYSGSAGDSLNGIYYNGQTHNGQMFSTWDSNSTNSCAAIYGGGWWYHDCYTANLNLMLWPKGIWHNRNNHHPQLDMVSMKIREK